MPVKLCCALPIWMAIACLEEMAQEEMFVWLFSRPFGALPYYALWNTFAHYVSSYPVEIQDHGQSGRFTMGNGRKKSVQQSHLMAIYSLLVVG